jgi:competence protein ComEA
MGGSAVALAVLAFALAFGSGSAGSVAVDGASAFGNPRASALSSDPIGALSSGRILVVEIVGAVHRPGVFRLPAGSRVGDLVAAAGGFGARVDADRAGRELNLAAPLRDGDQIRVPSRDDATVSGGGGSKPTGSGTAPAPIDLNRATAAELDTLPGIGPATAAKILASRDEQPFAAVSDLQTRKLVGAKTFEKLKDLVTVP